MPTAAPQIPPFPPYEAMPGISKELYDYLKALDMIVRIIRSEIP